MNSMSILVENSHIVGNFFILLRELGLEMFLLVLKLIGLFLLLESL
jgi:hypothetical protein